MKNCFVFCLVLLNSALGIFFHNWISPKLASGTKKLIEYEPMGHRLVQESGSILVALPVVVCIWGLLAFRYPKLRSDVCVALFSILFSLCYLLYAFLALTPILSVSSRQKHHTKHCGSFTCELDRPIIAQAMPAELNGRLERLLGYDHFSKRSKAHLF